MEIAADIDALGLLCPLPVLRVRKVLAALAPCRIFVPKPGTASSAPRTWTALKPI
jgi:TusA-related sulfurtransferase